ncbi:PA2778 family cysteine peptidase [Lentisalinibacter sediminis]|uniref:PA2778 family cysteine peptidase n=1 Tax=Lentisalinibacter sediminis TaxID=2992237 RepID=UPI00386D20E5
MRRLQRLAVCVGVLALGGCAAPGVPVADMTSAPLELEDTPFFPQERYQCGPAALATVLSASGVAVAPEALVDEVFLPGRQGSLQAELIATARRRGRVPYRLPPFQEALAAELAAGRPVLVLQNLGVSAFPRWHYAVVVGMDPERDAYVLRSGTERRRVTGRGVFLRTWSRSGNWGLVMLDRAELPAADDPDGYLRALAAVEATGGIALARAGYRAALGRWPGNRLARLGLGNIALAGGRPEEAASHYRALLDDDPDDLVALNNLAEALGRAGRPPEALRYIERALAAAPPGHPLRPVLEQTRRDLAGAAQN